MSLRKKLSHTFRQIGISEGCLYFLSIILSKLTGGHARMIRYHFVAQPVPVGGKSRMRPDKRSVIELIDRDHPLVSSFPRPADVIQKRFDNGHLCFVAKTEEQFSGFLWIAKSQYEEDEVRCCYRLLDPEESAWDFDVYVEPEYRHGRMLARLWDFANHYMALEGKKWSFSRISSSNSESLRSHARLGIQKLFSATFLSLGKFQITLTSKKPFIHASLSENSRPTLYLAPP